MAVSWAIVVGMDLHRRRSVLVRMAMDGRKLETARIANSPAALRAVIARAGQNPQVVVEATYGWYWAADVLEAAGAEVHLAHPLGVKAFSYRRVKNDERDCADLADLLRLGRLPQAWIAPPPVRALREITRYRHKLVGQRTSCKDQVHAVLAKCGIAVARSDIFGRGGGIWLNGLPLPAPYAGKLASLRALIGVLDSEIARLEEQAAAVLAGDRGYAAIRQLPGIGPVLGAVISPRRSGTSPGSARARAAGQLGGPDPAPPRVRYQGDPRACVQAGFADAALGGGRGDPAAARRDQAAAGQGRDHRPPRRPGPQHRQDRRRPPAAHLSVPRHARRAHPPRHQPGSVSCRPGRARGREVLCSPPQPAPAGPAARTET
jgi:transposase